MNAIVIRPEEAADMAAIHALTQLAFTDMPFSEGDEADLVDQLRKDGDLALSFVAEDDSIVGHIAFSEVTISDGATGWYGLGPVSVTPLRQGEGIGSALILHGLATLRAMGANGCILLGNPDYYGRFGFVADPALVYPGPPAKYFQSLVLNGPMPSGEVTYPPAFR